VSRNPYQPADPSWHGLYNGSTSRDDLLFTGESVSHPAKGSIPLFNRILDTMVEFGWLVPGSIVCDPFGGRGTTAALWCARDPANRAVTVELEPHFCAMQAANKRHAEGKLGRPLRWQIIQGDSRNLPDLLAAWGAACCTSPPYGNGLGKVVETRDPARSAADQARDLLQSRGLGSSYGATPGNLGNLPDPDPPTACCTSPPYAGSTAHEDRPSKHTEGYAERFGRIRLLKEDPHVYGTTPGNLGNLPDPAAVTSPPFADSVPASERPCKLTPEYMARYGHVGSEHAHRGYGATPGQIGAAPAETYEAACLQVYQGLAAAGVRFLAVVVKCPTRNGRLRRLDKATARLLRAAGYRIRGWRRAHLFERQAQRDARHGQGSLFADVEPSQKVVGRLSFFRRLHLAKGGVAAAWEDCFFAELAGAGAGACVTSPPYAESLASNHPQDAPTNVSARKCIQGSDAFLGRNYGATPGQIGNLKDPDPAPVAAVTSPPYGDAEVMTPGGSIGAAWQDGKAARETFLQEDKGARRYGRTPGQIGGLPDPVAITSPPYTGEGLGHVGAEGPGATGNARRRARIAAGAPTERAAAGLGEGYGTTPGNIGNLRDGGD